MCWSGDSLEANDQERDSLGTGIRPRLSSDGPNCPCWEEDLACPSLFLCSCPCRLWICLCLCPCWTYHHHQTCLCPCPGSSHATWSTQPVALKSQSAPPPQQPSCWRRHLEEQLQRRHQQLQSHLPGSQHPLHHRPHHHIRPQVQPLSRNQPARPHTHASLCRHTHWRPHPQWYAMPFCHVQVSDHV